jgi:hypothetical protein
LKRGRSRMSSSAFPFGLDFWTALERAFIGHFLGCP